MIQTRDDPAESVREDRKVTQLVLVAPRQIVLDALGRLLERHQDIRVAGQTNDPAGTLAIAELGADVVVIDAGAASEWSLDLLKALPLVNAASRSVVLTARDDPHHIREAVRLGAAAYLLNGAGETELVEAIRTVAHGGSQLSPAAMRLLLLAQEDAGPPLSTREREVLRLTARGHSNAEIATELSVSAKTVDTYRTRIMTKLGLHRRSELVEYALREGILERSAS